MKLLTAATLFVFGITTAIGSLAQPQQPLAKKSIPAKQVSISFPNDASVINLKRDYGAKGDGKTDDTQALQRAIESSSDRSTAGGTAILFIPNGVYLVSQTLHVKSRVGPWIYGESRDGVIIRLADGSKDCKSVLRTHPNDEGSTSADWFMRNIRNITIDVGNNPETDGIRYFATNSGILKNVRVMGKGKIGVNAGFMGQSGPNLVQDVVIEGFETGLLSQWIWGQTLSRVTIRNCRKEGVVVSANAVAIEDLVVENTPLPLFINYPEHWTWWGGVVALIGGRFSGGNPEGAAIRNRNVLYARNVQTKGFKHAIQSETPAGNVETANVQEYQSHPIKSAFEASPTPLNLPIKPEPNFPWENDPKKWVCANDFGAKFGDNVDDTEAIQKAIDHAAKEKKTTVYLRGIRGGDPNWYNVEGEIRIHGSVRHILGLGFGRILGGKNGRFIVTDQSAPMVKFQHIDAFGGPPVVIENQSKNRTLLVESCGVRIVGSGTGDIFATDVPGLLELKNPGQKVWARHLNAEGNDDIGLVRNAGGDLWVLGFKTEGVGVRFLTSQKGRTEVYGSFIYGSGLKDGDMRPIFDVDNAALSVVGIREITFGGHNYFVKVREKRGTETRTVSSQNEHPWIGWSHYSGWNKPVSPKK